MNKLNMVRVTLYVAILIFFVLTVIGNVQKQSNVGNFGIISYSGSESLTMEFYTNSTKSQKLTMLNWPTNVPGGTVNTKFYAYNNGTLPFRFAYFTTTNWNPTTAGSYMTLGWDCQNKTASVGSGVTVTMTITASSSITGIYGYTFNLIITIVQV